MSIAFGQPRDSTLKSLLILSTDMELVTHFCGGEQYQFAITNTAIEYSMPRKYPIVAHKLKMCIEIMKYVYFFAFLVIQNVVFYFKYFIYLHMTICTLYLIILSFDGRKHFHNT